MKQTLLSMTQDILSSMSSDEVNTISDNPESMQVANIIKQKYFDIVTRVPLPEHEMLLQLDPSLDEDSPVLMYVPDGVANIKWVKYFDSNVNDGTSVASHGVNTDITNNTTVWATTSFTSNTIGTGNKTFTVSAGLHVTAGQSVVAMVDINNTMTGTVVSYVGTTLVINVTTTKGGGTYSSWSISSGTSIPYGPGYLDVVILPNREFIDMVSKFNPSETEVNSFSLSDQSTGKNFVFYYKDDRQPQYCTIIKNFYVVFDSYDNTQDSTLQSDKSMVFGQMNPTWRMEDTFIPDLADEQFPLLLNEAKALAFFELKQQPHQLALQETKRGWSNIQKNKAVANRPTPFNELPNFGRFGRGGYGVPSYFKLRGFDR